MPTAQHDLLHFFWSAPLFRPSPSAKITSMAHYSNFFLFKGNVGTQHRLDLLPIASVLPCDFMPHCFQILPLYCLVISMAHCSRFASVLSCNFDGSQFQDLPLYCLVISMAHCSRFVSVLSCNFYGSLFQICVCIVL